MQLDLALDCLWNCFCRLLHCNATNDKNNGIFHGGNMKAIIGFGNALYQFVVRPAAWLVAKNLAQISMFNLR